MGESRSRLLKLKTERDLDVSAVRVTGDERESQRRGKEEDQRKVTRTLTPCAHMADRAAFVSSHITWSLLVKQFLRV